MPIFGTDPESIVLLEMGVFQNSIRLVATLSSGSGILLTWFKYVSFP